MKKLLLLIFCILLLGCDKDEPKRQGIACLPPATQTGAGTFGCLVNGEPFVDNSGNFNCFYQNVGGEFYFGIRSRANILNLRQIDIGSLRKSILINLDIPLNKYINNEFYAEISYKNQKTGAWTTSAPDGIINFHKFDLNEKIVSATFSLTIVNEYGKKHKITEGRFDSKFTQ